MSGGVREPLPLLMRPCHMISPSQLPHARCTAIFGASGGIGAALCQEAVRRGSRLWAGTRSGDSGLSDVRDFAFDLAQESTLADAAAMMRVDPPDCVIVATGVLTLADGTGPERSYRKLDPEVMAQVFALNTIGPALIAKHMLPLLPRDRRGVFAALSARVGSISDNRLGGWHSYRASKAALNMLLKNFAIELARTHKHSVVLGLHPGTVDSGLSAPFQSNLPEGQLSRPQDAACHLLDVIQSAGPQDSGNVFAYDGEKVLP